MPTYNNLPAPSQHFKGKWYRELIEDLQLAGKAKRTVYGYVRAVRKLANFCTKAPEELGEADLREFLLYQVVEKEAAAGTQSGFLCEPMRTIPTKTKQHPTQPLSDIPRSQTLNCFKFGKPWFNYASCGESLNLF